MIDQIEVKAVLLYRNIKTGDISMMVHDVISSGQGKILSAGCHLDDVQQSSLVEMLSGSKFGKANYLPDNLISYSIRTVCWWVPAGVRSLRFSSDNGYVDLQVPYPPMVIKFDNGRIYVAAIKNNRKPSLEDNLYFAPLMCCDNHFEMCQGNIGIRKNADIDNIEHWNEFVFEGGKTHLSNKKAIKIFDIDEYNVETDEGHIRFWGDLSSSGAGKFPLKRLVKSSYSLEDFLNV